MLWDQKYPKFGIIKIDRKNVSVYSDPDDYITIGLVEEVTLAAWAGDELEITCVNGVTRRYKDRNSYIILSS